VSEKAFPVLVFQQIFSKRKKVTVTSLGKCSHLALHHVLGLNRRPDLRFRVQGSGFRVQGSGFEVKGSGYRVSTPFEHRSGVFRFGGPFWIRVWASEHDTARHDANIKSKTTTGVPR
jgi:hypothetical protein